MKIRNMRKQILLFVAVAFTPLEKIFARDTYWHSLDFRFSLSPSPVTNSTLPLQLSITSKNLFTSLIFCTFISIISFPFLRLHYTQENLYLQAFFPDTHPKIPFKVWENLDVFYSFRILFSVISIFFSFSR